MRRQKFLQSTKRKSENLSKQTTHNNEKVAIGNSRIKSIVGSLLIVISGLILNIDKLFAYFNIELDNLYGWPDTETLVWTTAQSISPLLILIAAYLRPYLFAIVVPIYFYLLQLAFIFNDEMQVDDSMTLIYLIGSAFLFFVTIYALKKRTEDLDYLRDIEYQNLLDENQQLKAELEKAKRRAA